MPDTCVRCDRCYGVGVAVSVIGKELHRSQCSSCDGVGLVVIEGRDSVRPLNMGDTFTIAGSKRHEVRAGFYQRYGT